MQRILVVGTQNKKKLGELQELLHGLPWVIQSLNDYPPMADVEETGKTFAENAAIKAIAFAKATGQTALAEDSGLVVPALGGEPGIYSARYAGTHGNDAANNAKLLQALADFPAEKRLAYYVCSAAIAEPDGTVWATAEGQCHGRILSQVQGQGGFGYDPLFFVAEYHRTFGELSPVVKAAISHRARAVARLRPQLIRRLA